MERSTRPAPRALLPSYKRRTFELDYDYFGCAIPPKPPLWPRIVAMLKGLRLIHARMR